MVVTLRMIISRHAPELPPTSTSAVGRARRPRPTAVSLNRRRRPPCSCWDDSEKTPREASRRRRRSRTDGSGWPSGRSSAADSGALAPPAHTAEGTPSRITAVSAMGTGIMLASSIMASRASASTTSCCCCSWGGGIVGTSS
nr:unnamed protein product [Digitaria exilis]